MVYWIHSTGASEVEAHGLSCSTACWILVPQPELKLVPPALQGRFLTTGPPAKSPAMTSDINYIELNQISQMKGTVLHKTVLISDTSCKCRGL